MERVGKKEADGDGKLIYFFTWPQFDRVGCAFDSIPYPCVVCQVLNNTSSYSFSALFMFSLRVLADNSCARVLCLYVSIF